MLSKVYLKTTNKIKVHNEVNAGGWRLLTSTTDDLTLTNGITGSDNTYNNMRWVHQSYSTTIPMSHEYDSTAMFTYLGGTWQYETAGANIASDRRLKTDIRPLWNAFLNLKAPSINNVHDDEDDMRTPESGSKNALSAVRQLRPVAFEYKKGGESKYSRYGFIAQEVELILPSLVQEQPSGHKVLQIRDLLAVLTLAIQRIDFDLEETRHTLDDIEHDFEKDISTLHPRIADLEVLLRETFKSMLVSEPEAATGELQQTDLVDALSKEEIDSLLKFI